MLGRSRILALIGACAAAASLLLPAADARPLPVGQDPIKPGEAYSGDFPDPAVLLVGTTFHAYSTTSYGLNVPTLSSPDLEHWTADPGSAGSPRGDALPRPPAWAASRSAPDGRVQATTWAPTVTRLGPTRYVLAYAVRTAGEHPRMCISLAFANRPRGPFTDTSTAPLVCPQRGAIDPQVFIAPSGRPWLVWRIDFYPAQLWAIRLKADASGIAAGAKNRLLAGIAQPWEGQIIENPAMIRYRGRFYLFYSANSYASTKYAVGYLICRTWYGGCVRPRTTPLLATSATLAGPGGPMPFVDKVGRLRLAYHAWRQGAVGYPSTAECRDTAVGCGQRRLYIARLGVLPDGLLTVVERS